MESIQLFCFICGHGDNSTDFIATTYDGEEMLVCVACDSKIYTHLQDYKHRLEQFLKHQERTMNLIDLLKKEQKKQKVSYSLLELIERKDIADSFSGKNK